MGGLGLLMRRRAIQAHPTISEGGYILSAEKGDAEVFRILLSKGVSSDGIGITKDDAAKVVSIDYWFRENKAIVDFDEFKYFASVTSLKGIPEYGAFTNCDALTRITLPESLTDIGSLSFKGCINLNTINLERVVIVGGTAFQNTGLSGTIVLQEAEQIGGSAFADNNHLVKVFAKKTRSIGGYCFSSDTLLEVADIGMAETIGDFAFYNCGNLKSVILRTATPPKMGILVFYGAGTFTIYVPDNAIDVYKSADGWSGMANQMKPLSEYVESL